MMVEECPYQILQSAVAEWMYSLDFDVGNTKKDFHSSFHLPHASEIVKRNYYWDLYFAILFVNTFSPLSK